MTEDPALIGEGVEGAFGQIREHGSENQRRGGQQHTATMNEVSSLEVSPFEQREETFQENSTFKLEKVDTKFGEQYSIKNSDDANYASNEDEDDPSVRPFLSMHHVGNESAAASLSHTENGSTKRAIATRLSTRKTPEDGVELSISITEKVASSCDTGNCSTKRVIATRMSTRKKSQDVVELSIAITSKTKLVASSSGTGKCAITNCSKFNRKSYFLSSMMQSSPIFT